MLYSISQKGSRTNFELESLTTIQGLCFFSIEDPEHITDEELYDWLTAEYPHWVKSARLENILS
ncbi:MULTISPECIES: VWA domain-containing protein [unclassified Microcoleus]|uniref:VWA domain-containing protein n=1 Tax=unclassified Microcoleus TaxID=2642155 RepID=UPI0025E027E7|nr:MULTISPECIES: VWA domain-containing protein [unclassified Microcoleus]